MLEQVGFHARSAHDVLGELGSGVGGLAPDEAARRLERYGRNELPAAKRRPPILRFLAQFNNALIYLLLVGAVAAFALGHYVDAGVIIGVVVINAIVGFVQEGRAESALDAIRDLIAPNASVIRHGHRTSIPASELVPGDIVHLEAGDRVPADLRLIRARGLLIDEALLTGESVAAGKAEGAVAADAPLGDRRSMAYSGTMVAAGQGTGAVVATGDSTEIGHISTMVRGVETLTTPLLRQINRFGQGFTWVAILGGVALFLFAVFARGFFWEDALLAVVAVIVGVTPEGLPAVITITLAIGVRRMAQRNAVIRQLPAVETIGATSVICSDKTGTLTRNEMTARRLVIPGARFMIDGSGYAPDGDALFAESVDGSSEARALTLVRTGLLCNDAALRREDHGWTVHGDPMEGALVTFAMREGFEPETERREWQRIDEIPFDAKHRLMATLNRVPYGEAVILAKGAPERLLDLCAAQAGDGGPVPVDHAYWAEQIADAAADGERVLAFATKHCPADRHDLHLADLDDGLVFLGLIGFVDPPRAEVVAAIAECHSAGIAVKMITGDHGATAIAIARQLGLADEPEVVTGRDLDAMDDAALARAVTRTTVFARTNPGHKLRIVQALQSDGAVVAMTGDGVNDAPALKQADIGIAMGRKGTEAAKEAARMVLLDDNFASIVAAVHEGRTVYDNIRKVIAWTIPTNGGEALTVIAAIVLSLTMPMTPAQILWINMISAVTLGLVLAFEPSEPGVMKRAPRAPDAGLLSPFLLWRAVFVSVLFSAASLMMFFYATSRGYDVATARTIVVNTLVVLEAFYLFNVRYLHTTSFTLRGALGTPPVLIALGIVIAAQFAFTYLPVMQSLFDTRSVALIDGVMIVAVGVAAMAILEAEKALIQSFGRRRGTAATA
ncbi:MAG: cation-transporting P-type ATPase [Bauldia sp.]|nr:cation-transporting P-type ATPase [Bauldia sp.]